MTTINFYQLANRRPEAVLPPLVAKALAAGHRLLVRTPDAALLAKLDAALWTNAPDSFLPHGIDTDLGDRAATQPVLLTLTAPPSANNADCLAQIAGDLPDDLTGLTRILYLFDSDALETARTRWRTLAKLPEITPVYWRETESGSFEKAG